MLENDNGRTATNDPNGSLKCISRDILYTQYHNTQSADDFNFEIDALFFVKIKQTKHIFAWIKIIYSVIQSIKNWTYILRRGKEFFLILIVVQNHNKTKKKLFISAEKGRNVHWCCCKWLKTSLLKQKHQNHEQKISRIMEMANRNWRFYVHQYFFHFAGRFIKIDVLYTLCSIQWTSINFLFFFN